MGHLSALSWQQRLQVVDLAGTYVLGRKDMLRGLWLYPSTCAVYLFLVYTSWLNSFSNSAFPALICIPFL